MKRRRFVGMIAGMLAVPAVGIAQPTMIAPKRVAILLGPSDAPDPIGPERRALAKEFAKHGLIDGKDIDIVIIRARTLEKTEDVVAAMRQAVALRAKAILTQAAGHGVKEFLLPLARDVPLVIWGPDDGSDDSIEALNRRGENVTGAMYSYFEMVAKRFEIMKELRPGATRAAFVIPRLQDQTEVSRNWERYVQERLRANVRKLGMELTFIELPRDVSADALVRALREARIDLVEISAVYPDGEFWEPLAKNGIAASGVGALRAQRGALLGGWSAGFEDTAIRLAARVLRGQRAAAIPVERSMEFGLAVNLRTARTLGITVPQWLLLRANEVFE